MPIYEFTCEHCGELLEELVAADGELPTCPACGAPMRRLFSPISPPGRGPRGAKARDSEARRVERESARRERLAETAKLRARGELPVPRKASGPGG